MIDTKKFPVMEIFGPTMQGEGMLAGTISHFIRFGGCTFRCSWCDTMFAVDPEQIKEGRTLMYAGEIAKAVYRLPDAAYITLSGGDPAMHINMDQVIRAIKEIYAPKSPRIAVETQGVFAPEWLSLCDAVTVSPKPPSSGMVDKFDRSALTAITGLTFGIAQRCLKIVVFTREDLRWALDVFEQFPSWDRYISVGTTPDDGTWGGTSNEDILEAYRGILADIYTSPAATWVNKPIHILPQIHTLLWGQERGK